MTGDGEESGASSSADTPVPARLPKQVQKRADKLAWLAQVDLDRAEDRLARLEGDKELISLLHGNNFEGRNYDVFANEMAKYGLAVIRAWVYKDLIWEKVKAKGFGALEPEPWAGALIEDVDSVADETIVLALIGFRDTVLRAGKWDPSKGASLRTFFVGQCLYKFSNVYRTWRRENLRNFTRNVGLDVTEDPSRARRSEDPSVHAGRAEELRNAFGKITDERARNAFYLQAVHGYKVREIAEKLSATEKAIESALGRARQQIRDGENTA